MRVFNTLGRRYEEFVPRTEGEVAIYVCGPTVQSEPHVGHGRSAVAFDVIRRYLEWRGFRVLYVRNITDIEDKIIAAAAEAGVPVAELAEANSKRFQEAYLALGALAPDIEPKATEHIPEMIELISHAHRPRPRLPVVGRRLLLGAGRSSRMGGCLAETSMSCWPGLASSLPS